MFQLRPTARQHVALAGCVDGHRELYNAALQERRDGWSHGKTRIRYGDQSAQLSEIRAARPDQAVWSFSSQQATLRRLNKSFDGFFRRVKAGQKAGYPRFKGAALFDSVLWPKVGDDVPDNPLPAAGRQGGIDAGIASFATTSDGEHLAYPRWGRRAAARLARAQQRLQRARRGGRNRQPKRETVAARHRKIANQRKDFHHQQARRLVDQYDVLVVEDLAIANMVRRAKPVPDLDHPGSYLSNGARAKSGLNRSISDAGWGLSLSILRAKAEDAGRVWIEVDPRHTSDGCESCGYAARDNRVRQAEFVCQRCRHHAQADEHAARNILRAGLALHTHAA